MNALSWLLPGIAVHGALWQLFEAKLQDWAELGLAWLTGKPANQVTQYDAQGIPRQLYRRHGLQYNPLFVALQARNGFARLGNPRKKAEFFKLTDWLLSYAEESDGKLLFPYRFDIPELGLRAPWYSCLAQATAMECFAQRSTLPGEEAWQEHCRKVLRSLEPGQGLAQTEAGEELWFPEYPGTAKNHVLNGMASVLLDLDSTFKMTSIEQSQNLFQRGFATYIKLLPGFDYRGFSYYSLDKTVTSRGYHQIHIRQLRKLNALRPHPVLQKYLRRWSRHDLIPVALQLFYNPRPKRIAAFLASLGVILGVACLLSCAVWR